MKLRSGIPTISDLDQLLADAYYSQHTGANDAFLNRHGPALSGYGKHWGNDPFQLWSRRWEYPYVAQRVLEFAAEQPNAASIKMLDAGSGVTYLPYFLCEQIENLSVVAVDYDQSYIPMFAAINKNLGQERVTFKPSDLRNLPLEDDSFDIVACVSVLEHTDEYPTIIREFERILRPGGALILTFDLSLDGKFTLDYPTASSLLSQVSAAMHVSDELRVDNELEKMKSPKGLLTTDAVKQTDPQLLPWRFPALKAAHDLVKGHGWTGGFRSKSVFCLEARKAT